MSSLGSMTMKEVSSLVSFIKDQNLHFIIHSGKVIRIDSFALLLEFLKEAEFAQRQGSLSNSAYMSTLSLINKPQDTLQTDLRSCFYSFDYVNVDQVRQLAEKHAVLKEVF